jgi:hypothetical protein
MPIIPVHYKTKLSSGIIKLLARFSLWDASVYVLDMQHQTRWYLFVTVITWNKMGLFTVSDNILGAGQLDINIFTGKDNLETKGANTRCSVITSLMNTQTIKHFRGMC